jgi:hypothetical protein
VIEQQKTYLKLILRDGHIHPSQDKVIAAFVYECDTQRKLYYNFDHPDLPKNSTLKKVVQSLTNKKVFVLNKKTHKYFVSGLNLYDANLFQFFKDGNVFEPNKHKFSETLQMTHHRINGSGIIIPYVVHQKEFDSEIEVVKDSLNGKTDTYCYKFFNEVVSDTLFEVERNGLHVDTPLFKSYFPNAKVVGGSGEDDTVYTEYHIYNPTGRPSNKFDSVNYVALNKADGCRASFSSRYANGKLLMVDFTGFHPYIVANLIGYKVPDDETVYEHLAKQYYGVDTVSKDLLSKAKKLTMVNLYGQISKQYIHIPYFEKTEKLKDKYWEVFTQKGYVKTPIYKRKITANHITDPNKNKLFAYIIQATETEYGLNSLSNCLKYSFGKSIKPILYIYDSILFDIDGDVPQSEIDDIVNIIRGNRFKVKVYVGNNYNDLKLV